MALMRWPDRIDRLLGALKWPAAYASLLLVPLLAWSLFLLALRLVFDPLPLVPFAAGTVAWIVLWRRYLGRSRFGRFLITLEHESTHALFALLCLHRIVGFRASVGRGGEVRYTGRGNWLITAAPYFFPTAALLLFVVAYLLPFPGLPWHGFLLGVALGYHIVSTWRETHRDQTDIHELGLTFCWMFLPAANLAVVGLLVAYAHDWDNGISNWLSDVVSPASDAASWIWNLVRPASPDVPPIPKAA